MGNHKRKHQEQDEEQSREIQLIMKDRVGLKKVTGNPDILTAEELEADDAEIFLIQCPKNIRVQELLQGKKITLSNGCVTSLGNNNDNNEDEDIEYESIAVLADDNNEKTLTTVLPDTSGDMKVVSSRLCGHLIIRESVTEAVAPLFKTKRKGLHQLPSGIKERHPIFGTDFTQQLLGMENGYKSNTKQNKKKKHRVFEIEDERIEQVDLEPEPLLSMENGLDSNKKRHKKKKRSFETDGEMLNQFPSEPEPLLSLEIGSNFNKKKKKRNFETEEDEVPLEPESLLSIEKDSDFGLTLHKKKKKRSFETSDDQLPLESEPLPSFETGDSNKKKKKRSFKTAEDELPLQPNPLLSTENYSDANIVNIVKQHKKKKRHIKTEEDDELPLEPEPLFSKEKNSDSDLQSKKKTKRSFKTEPSEALLSMNNESDSNMKQHKKKKRS